MVTGRVEVREEVVRTGCSESVKEEVGDAERGSLLLFTLENGLQGVL